MSTFAILLGMLQVLRVKTTIYEVFDDANEIESKYMELIEVTASITNRNAIESSSKFVGTIGVNNEHYVSEKVLKKISTAIASPSKVHGLSRNTIIFARNSSDISLEEYLDDIYRRGELVICVTGLYSKSTEFLEQFTKVASNLWANRVSQMIFIAWIGDELNIYGIRPYDEKTCFPTELIKIGTVRNGTVFKEVPFFKRIKNLNNCPLRVATTSGMPYIEILIENNVTRMKGYEGNILDTLSKRMNFTLIINDTEKIPGFDTAFNNVKDTLKFNKSDLCFGGKKVSLLYGIEPTITIMDCLKIWVVPKAEEIEPWMYEIIPFEKTVWTMLGFTLFFIAVICLLSDSEIFSIMNMWSLFLGVGINMKENSAPSKDLVRIVLASWIFFSYVITHLYLASLEGYLTNPTFLPEINTLEELAASGIAIEGHSVVSKLFCEYPETPVIRVICDRLKKKSIQGIFDDMELKGKLESAFTIKAELYESSKFIRDYDTHVMKEIVQKYPTAFLAQTGAPFMDEMNTIMTRLIETGFIHLWRRQNILMRHKKEHYPETLRVEHVLGIISIATLGYTISIIIFCIEYWVHHNHLASLKNNNQWRRHQRHSEMRNVVLRRSKDV